METREITNLIDELRQSEPGVQVEFDTGFSDRKLYRFHIFDPHFPKRKGFGADFDIKKAFIKAQSEYYERKIFLDYAVEGEDDVWSSSGFACHVSFDLADDNAFCEIIERDAFLMSWIARIPPVWLESSILSELVPQYNQMLFQQSKVDLRIGFVAKVGDVFVAISCILLERSGHKVRFAIDTSASRSAETALQSVYVGSLVRLDTFLNADRTRPVDLDSPMHHFFRHADFFSNSAWLIDGGEKLLEYEQPSSAYKHWNVEVSMQKLYISYCKADVQQYFTGNTTDGKLNIPRILGVTKANYQDFNRETHPLP